MCLEEKLEKDMQSFDDDDMTDYILIYLHTKRRRLVVFYNVKNNL